MKVCIVTPELKGPGGWGRYVRDLTDALTAQGVTCNVLTVRGRGIGALATIWRGVRGANLVHAIDPVPVGIHAFFAAKLRNIPFVLTAQGTYAVAPLYNIKTAWLSKFVYEHAHTVIAISRFTRDELLRRAPRANVQVVNHGVWLRNFQTTPRARPARLTLLSVGGMKRRKGYHVALEAVALLRATHPDIHYTLVGPSDSPGFAQMLRSRASADDLRGAVDFKVGITDDELKAEYGKAALFVLPAVNEGHHFEGFGLVFLEAAAAGLPSVGTKGNGIEDAIVDGVTGILVAQNNPHDTAAAIERVWADWDRMSTAARAYAQGRDWGDVAKVYVSLYTKVLAQYGRSV